MTDIKDTTLRGVNLLRNPWFNKSSAFTEKERDELGLRGLLPPRVSTFDEQVTRLKGIIDTYEKPINKYIVLEGAHNSDECLLPPSNRIFPSAAREPLRCRIPSNAQAKPVPCCP